MFKRLALSLWTMLVSSYRNGATQMRTSLRRRVLFPRGDGRYIVLIGALGLGLILMISCSWQVPIPVDNDLPTYPANELMEAFIAADLGRAKAVTVLEQWEKLEQEMAGRQPFWCRVGWLEPIPGPVPIDGKMIAEREWLFTYLYDCTWTPTYCLEIRDIRVRETEGGWKVYDWGKICEGSYEDECREMCRQ